MGNPHPTNSKPIKIGRKHTGELGIRAKGRKTSLQHRANKQKNIMIRKWKDQVAEYYRGERENYPHKPDRLVNFRVSQYF